ncbi:hypothetical protein GX51_05751 [Blastomyces parvus]|uniref:Uncharacterized protein n=1 Tax=Blastomyces parvus TaxID=2060905 RepID=A0A2B7WUR1_9EURO|nr:hypothetical protein GX51_05751 [Blastomyces parvus]
MDRIDAGVAERALNILFLPAASVASGSGKQSTATLRAFYGGGAVRYVGESQKHEGGEWSYRISWLYKIGEQVTSLQDPSNPRPTSNSSTFNNTRDVRTVDTFNNARQQHTVWEFGRWAAERTIEKGALLPEIEQPNDASSIARAGDGSAQPSRHV